ncbi:uncharacterized protein BX663DRAFT_529875 [Cokeromyces recurvatus]|uniref:uncharacterized protein n=1 Tax=Cokeromyces recurvatus TaxID=90255 RepID=UPI0022202C6F|nr:uncharacterized protein BX663DRAFT_529875 [Cokeromyces recurvatus]KAI7904934.1 hypothetical protein BX663DRAFT_529875 [Cokeromyces recurvatus]
MPKKTSSSVQKTPNELVSSVKSSSLNLTDIESDSISKIAKKYFSDNVEWDPEVVKTIIKNELEPAEFSSQKLSVLEFYHYLEKYLWPHYNEEASLDHVISICLLVYEKARQSIPLWDAFADDTEKFSLFFRRIIHLIVDPELPLFFSRQLLIFLIHCFQSFDNNFVRTECLKLVTIGIWAHLAHEGKRDQLFSNYPNLLKLWNTNNKKLAAASKFRRKKKF